MFRVRAIKSNEDYVAALARVEQLWDAPEGSADADELDVVSLLIKAFEDQNFPADVVTPVEAIKFRMEQQGLTRRDLIPLIGSSGRVSEVLSGKRPLSLSMIRALHEHLNIPAELLISEPAQNER